MNVAIGDKKMTFDGTYTLKGDTVTTKLKYGKDEHTDNFKINKITEKEMETENKEGLKNKFKKVSAQPDTR